MANVIGKTYPMTDVTVTVKAFHNAEGEQVVFFDVVGKIGDCRKHLKANAEKDFFLDYLAHHVKEVPAPANS